MAKHQAAVAQLTADNLVLLLRMRAAEDEVAAGKREREELKAALDEQRGPWFDEVRMLFTCAQRCSEIERHYDAPCAFAQTCLGNLIPTSSANRFMR